MKRKYKSIAFSDDAIDRAVEDGIMCAMPPEEPYEICDAKIRGIEMSNEELLDLLEGYAPSTQRPSRRALERLEKRPRGVSTFIQPPGEPIKIVG